MKINSIFRITKRIELLLLLKSEPMQGFQGVCGNPCAFEYCTCSRAYYLFNLEKEAKAAAKKHADTLE